MYEKNVLGAIVHNNPVRSPFLINVSNSYHVEVDSQEPFFLLYFFYSFLNFINFFVIFYILNILKNKKNIKEKKALDCPPPW